MIRLRCLDAGICLYGSDFGGEWAIPHHTWGECRRFPGTLMRRYPRYVRNLTFRNEPLHAVRQGEHNKQNNKPFFRVLENRHFGHPRSSGDVPGAPGRIADWIIRVPGVNSQVNFLGWKLVLWMV